MTYSDCGVFAQQHHRERLADDVAAADYYGMFPRNLDIRPFQDLYYSSRRTRLQRVVTLRQPADINRVKTINIFARVYGFQDLGLRQICARNGNWT